MRRAFAIYGVGIPIVAFSYDFGVNYQHQHIVRKNGNKCETRIVFNPPKNSYFTTLECIGALSFANFARIALFAPNASIVFTGIGLGGLYMFDRLVGFLCSAYFVAKIK